mmetsp:Transcript_16135/g.22494  ORF Transcript_16135/g.22494 Transcript_16135/m.22494 type:complete len:109 (+) Transcript_16135:656-982(+)
MLYSASSADRHHPHLLLVPNCFVILTQLTCENNNEETINNNDDDESKSVGLIPIACPRAKHFDIYCAVGNQGQRCSVGLLTTKPVRLLVIVGLQLLRLFTMCTLTCRY